MDCVTCSESSSAHVCCKEPNFCLHRCKPSSNFLVPELVNAFSVPYRSGEGNWVGSKHVYLTWFIFQRCNCGVKLRRVIPELYMCVLGGVGQRPVCLHKDYTRTLLTLQLNGKTEVDT